MLLAMVAFSVTMLCGCSSKTEKTMRSPLLEDILGNPASEFYLDTLGYSSKMDTLPIGLLDSGLGGLCVLEDILGADNFDNVKSTKDPDRVNDFAGEQFLYLGNVASIPYGTQTQEDKIQQLRNNVVKNASFLMQNRVKVIVLACNTSHAFATEDIEELVRESGVPVKVCGVSDAGINKCVAALKKGEGVSVAVMAAKSTIESGLYEQSIKELARKKGVGASVSIVSYPVTGLTEAMSGDTHYMDKSIRYPRSKYSGPSNVNINFKIELSLLPVYSFDFSSNRMLYSGSISRPTLLQINSPENYVRYHVVSLLEKMRMSSRPKPLKYIVLGCSHLTYYKDLVRKILQDLRFYRANGVYPYRSLISENVELIDPAKEMQQMLYSLLEKEHLLAHSTKKTSVKYFMTKPLEEVETSENEIQIVPFGKDFIYESNTRIVLSHLNNCLKFMPEYGMPIFADTLNLAYPNNND